MSSDRKKDDENPRIDFTEMDDQEALRLAEELEQNIQIARKLKEDILAEEAPGLAVRKSDNGGMARSFTYIQESSERRMEALLTKSVGTREKTMRFLSLLIQLVDKRTGLDPKKITNSEEYVRETVDLVTKVDRFKSLIKDIANMLQSSLTTNNEGVAECNVENTGMVRSVLFRASESIDKLGEAELVADDTISLGSTTYMEPDRPVVDLFARLRDARQRVLSDRDIIEIFDILGGHLKSLVEKTGLNVEMDTRYSAAQFAELKEYVTKIATEVGEAEFIGSDISSESKGDWDSALTNFAYVLAEIIGRTEHLYNPNADDFLKLIDTETLEKRYRRLRKEGDVLKGWQKEKRELQNSTSGSVVRVLRGFFSAKEEEAPVSMGRLTMDQKALQKKIFELSNVMERRRVLSLRSQT